MYMINRKLLLERQALNKLKQLNEQDSDEYYDISAEDYIELLKLSGYNSKVTKIKKFGGKPLRIKGDVKLSGKPIDSLGNVAHIDGSLDISGTKIFSLGNTEVTKYVWDGNTPLRKRLDIEEINREKEKMSYDRENNTRDINNSSISNSDLKAIALFKYLVTTNTVKELDDEDRQNIIEIEAELNRFKELYDKSEEPEEIDEIYDKISELEERLEELKPEFDVYDLNEERYIYYGLTTFKILQYDLKDNEYTVGTESEMDSALQEYCENYLDDVGIDGFNTSFIENYIDEYYFESYVRDFYEDDIRQNPDIYFDDEDFELTEEQESRIEELQNYIEELENYISEKTDEQSDFESEIEDADEYSQKWDEVQQMIDDAEKKIETAQEELDDIKPNTDEPTEEMIESRLSDRVSEAQSDVADWIKEHGLTLKDFIDEKKMASGLAEEEGYRLMNGYDGDYDTEFVNNTRFYIMRIN